MSFKTNLIIVQQVKETKSVREPTVELRPFTKNDLEAFWMWASDDAVTQFLMWESYKTKAEAEKFLSENAQQQPWLRAIVHKGEVVGSISLDQGEGNTSCTAELGYVLAKKFWGKGIGTASIKQAINQGFSELSIVRIEAYVDSENRASQRVLEKNGFEREGFLRKCIKQKGIIRDRYLYSLIND